MYTHFHIFHLAYRKRKQNTMNDFALPAMLVLLFLAPKNLFSFFVYRRILYDMSTNLYH